MALYILQPGVQPLGQFDFDDTDLPNVVGGDLATLDRTSARTNTSSEKHAADADGYSADLIDVGTPTGYRTLFRLADSATETAKPMYLIDDGKTGYGTLFGQVIGVPAGLSTTGTNAGPHTASASGKVTLWDKAGLYAISLDALDTGVVPYTSGNLYDTPIPGDLLYRGANTGKLSKTQTGSEKFVAMFVELTNSRSLVNTPAALVGSTSSLFDRIVVQYVGVENTI